MSAGQLDIVLRCWMLVCHCMVPLGLLFFFINNPHKPVNPQLMTATVIAFVVPVMLYAIGQRSIDSGVSIAEIAELLLLYEPLVIL